MGIIKKPDWLSRDPWVNRGEKFAPVLNLPDGRVFGPVQKRKDVTPQSIIGRCGVIGVMNYDAPNAVRHGFHHAMDLKAMLGGSAPALATSMTRDQVRSLASSYPILPIEGNDFGEGNYAFTPETDQAMWWYERRKEMYADPALNPAGIVRRDYGHHGCTIALQGSAGPWHLDGGSEGSPTDPYFRGRYASVAAARSGVGYFNTTLGSTRYEDLVGCNIKNYSETADYART